MATLGNCQKVITLPMFIYYLMAEKVSLEKEAYTGKINGATVRLVPYQNKEKSRYLIVSTIIKDHGAEGGT